jgi:hypothetical protein
MGWAGWALWYREQEFALDSTLRERARDLWQRYQVRRAERKPWTEAETLADLGELTARWAEGTAKYHPGGYDEGPAEETLEIAPALVTLNRSGFVTSGSQPGESAEVGYDGDLWWQRAAVDGFTDPDTADRLEDACDAAGLVFINNGPARLRTNWRDAVPATVKAPSDVTEDPPAEGCPDEAGYYVTTCFGTHLSRRAVRFEFDGFGADALLAAEQITVIDPVFGRKDLLWDTLIKAVDPCCPCQES